MRSSQTRPRGRFGRLLVATLIITSVPLLVPSVSSAGSTSQALDQAKAKLAQLNGQLDVLIEQYDQARTALNRPKRRSARPARTPPLRRRRPPRPRPSWTPGPPPRTRPPVRRSARSWE